MAIFVEYVKFGLGRDRIEPQVHLLLIRDTRYLIPPTDLNPNRYQYRVPRILYRVSEAVTEAVEVTSNFVGLTRDREYLPQLG